MKTKYLSLIAILFVALITASCRKEPNTNDLIDDKDKIDIKGSLSNGDMRYPNIEAGYWGKTVYVYFHEYMGECVVSISNRQDQVVFCDTVTTGYDTGTRFYMGDQPLSRYHLVISNGTDEAEGWFNNFHIVAHKP
jgi:hypothetical protein